MEKTTCPSCRQEIDREDRFCRYCGEQTGPGGQASFVPIEIVPEPANDRPSAMDNPWVVLSMIFLVLGPLALPMLWRGKAFSARGKLIITILTLLYVVFLLWLGLFLADKFVLEPIRKALSFQH
jgi:hypothetical protein